MQRGSERDSIQSTLEDRPTWEFERVVVAQIGKKPVTATINHDYAARVESREKPRPPTGIGKRPIPLEGGGEGDTAEATSSVITA